MSDVSGLTSDAHGGEARASDEEHAGRRDSVPGPREDGRKRRFMDQEDRSRRIKAQVLCVVTIVTGLAYLGWIVFALNPAHPVLGIGFLASEAACLTLFACASS